jgi:hypothetical protein
VLLLLTRLLLCCHGSQRADSVIMAAPPDDDKALQEPQPPEPAWPATNSEVQARREALPSVRPFPGNDEVAGVSASPFGREPATELPPDARPRPKQAVFPAQSVMEEPASPK